MGRRILAPSQPVFKLCLKHPVLQGEKKSSKCCFIISDCCLMLSALSRQRVLKPLDLKLAIEDKADWQDRQSCLLAQEVPG